MGNSVLFGCVEKTSSLQSAITRLGLDSTKSLVINYALMQLISPLKGPVNKSIKQIHLHSIVVAATSYLLAKKSRKINKNTRTRKQIISRITMSSIALKPAQSAEQVRNTL